MNSVIIKQVISKLSNTFMTKPTVKIPISIYLLKIVFSIYLLITVLTTFMQMANEYLHDETVVNNWLQTTQTIFEPTLTDAAWTLDETELSAALKGILHVPVIVGIKIDNMDKPPKWNKPFPIRLGTILDNKQIASIENGIITPVKSHYIRLISHYFQLKKTI